MAKTKHDTTPITPHDVATDGLAPDDAANSGTAPNTPANAVDVDMKQINAAADKFDFNGPGVQQIGDFIVVDPNTPEGKAKADELDAESAEATMPAPYVKTPGTVTVDFGIGPCILDCLVMGSVPGAVQGFAAGQQVQVVVPTAEGTTTISVDGRFVR